MTDRDAPVGAYSSLRSILRAIDESDGDMEPLFDRPGQEPDAGSGFGNSGGLKYERVTATEPGPSQLAAPHPSKEQSRSPSSRRVSLLGRVCIESASLLGLVLTGAVLVIPAPTKEWARAALDEGRPAAHQPADKVPMTERDDDAGQQLPDGLHAFAQLARKAFAKADGAAAIEAAKSVFPPEMQEATSLIADPPEVVLQPVADEGLMRSGPAQ